jgi:hypothetical protein
MNRAILISAICMCVGWTRLTGRVKGINLKDSTVTIQDRDNDLLTIPVDYQVKIIEKHDELRDLKHLVLDDKITLINTPAEKPKDDSFSDMNTQK